VVISPNTYPRQSSSYYQNVFTPLPPKPDLCPLYNPYLPKAKKMGPSIEGPSNLNVDQTFSSLEQQPRRLSEVKYMPPGVLSIDELVTFSTEQPKSKKTAKPKKKEDIDPLIWGDLMSSVSRDSQYRYVPGFQNLPATKNIPDHLMSDSVALNVSFQEKFSEESIAPSHFLSLPDVGLPEPAIPTQTDKPLSLEKTPQQPEPRIPSNDDEALQPPSLPPTPITRIPPPPKEEIKPSSNHIPPPPSLSAQPRSIPAPPPPPPANIPPPTPPALRITRRQPPIRPSPAVAPVEEDFQTQLYNRIISRRAGIEDEPEEKKKDQDEDDWN